MDNLSSEDINDLVFLCEKDFGLEKRMDTDFANFNTVVKWLEREIQILLNQDLQKLLHILYRIDISEESTNKVLSLTEPSQMAERLTELIIHRELQKIETRKKYRSN